uniref:secreted phosphoprotein 24-like n=1 Tax=Pristiophorus japonicus TaxID=55135 RepID=UPI00398F0927
MNSFLLTIAAVQILHCSGIPSPKDALRKSVIKLNEITETTNLCGITRRRVKDIYRTGKLSYNVDLTFSVKETVCSKNSGLEFDDPSCHFRPRKTAEKGFCKSRVEYFADKVVDIDVECRGLKTVDSSSDSSESSEDSIEVKTNSKATSLEESSNVKSKSQETSLEVSSNVKSKSNEWSLESEAKELSLEHKSEELSLESKSRELSLDSKSEELSLEESSNEHNDDSRD